MIHRSTAYQIDKITYRILKEAGMNRPPFLIEDLIAHLKLDHDFCDLTDRSFLQKVGHKIKVAGRKIIEITAILVMMAANQAVLTLLISGEWAQLSEGAAKHVRYFSHQT